VCGWLGVGVPKAAPRLPLDTSPLVASCMVLTFHHVHHLDLPREKLLASQPSLGTLGPRRLVQSTPPCRCSPH